MRSPGLSTRQTPTRPSGGPRNRAFARWRCSGGVQNRNHCGGMRSPGVCPSSTSGRSSPLSRRTRTRPRRTGPRRWSWRAPVGHGVGFPGRVAGPRHCRVDGGCSSWRVGPRLQRHRREGRSSARGMSPAGVDDPAPGQRRGRSSTPQVGGLRPRRRYSAAEQIAGAASRTTPRSWTGSGASTAAGGASGHVSTRRGARSLRRAGEPKAIPRRVQAARPSPWPATALAASGSICRKGQERWSSSGTAPRIVRRGPIAQAGKGGSDGSGPTPTGDATGAHSWSGPCARRHVTAEALGPPAPPSAQCSPDPHQDRVAIDLRLLLPVVDRPRPAAAPATAHRAAGVDAAVVRPHARPP